MDRPSSTETPGLGEVRSSQRPVLGPRSVSGLLGSCPFEPTLPRYSSDGATTRRVLHGNKCETFLTRPMVDLFRRSPLRSSVFGGRVWVRSSIPRVGPHTVSLSSVPWSFIPNLEKKWTSSLVPHKTPFELNPRKKFCLSVPSWEEFPFGLRARRQ